LKETAGARIKKGLEDKEADSQVVGADCDTSIATNTGALVDTIDVAIASGAPAREGTAELPTAVASISGQLNPDGDVTDAGSVADSIMSVGSSSSDEDQSHSTCGSSVSASGNRKRVAEESPEREREDSSRREFPGRVTRSAAGCRVYIPPMGDDKDELPARIVNDHGSVVEEITGPKDNVAPVSVGGEIEGTDLRDVGVSDTREETGGGYDVTVSTITATPLPSPFPVTSIPDSVPHVMTMARRLPEAVEMPILVIAHVRDAAVDNRLPLGPIVNDQTLAMRAIATEDEFGRDTCVVNEICQMIEGMPKPWSAYRAFEAATARFPNIDRAALRLTTMAVLMGQRRCINRMTNAGMQSGPRRDEDGAVYLELNNTCADNYRNSY